MACNQDNSNGFNAADTAAHRRLESFQAKCAAMRVKTAMELARLKKKRSDTRLNIGVTSERMQQWLDEHQRMLSDVQPGNP